MARYPRRVRNTSLILAFGCWLVAAEPPSNLAKLVAARETENEAARAEYTYRQTVTIEEFDRRNMRSGEYHEARDIVFLPGKERAERFVGRPRNTLTRLKLTEEDFRDIREVQPMLLTADLLWIYQVRFRGEETVESQDCWVLETRPRQILQGQRLFDGLLWVEKQGLSIIRTQGQAVPQIRGTKTENLFPRFTTIRGKIEGHWFPIYTHADDVLEFRSGPQRILMRIRYSDYKRFGAESTVKFGDAAPEK